MDKLKLKLSSIALRGIVSNLIRQAVRSKSGVNPDLDIRDLDIELENDTFKIHIDAAACISKGELMSLIKNAKISSAVMDKI